MPKKIAAQINNKKIILAICKIKMHRNIAIKIVGSFFRIVCLLFFYKLRVRATSLRYVSRPLSSLRITSVFSNESGRNAQSQRTSGAYAGFPKVLKRQAVRTLVIKKLSNKFHPIIFFPNVFDYIFNHFFGYVPTA